jgi:hypothetical protein
MEEENDLCAAITADLAGGSLYAHFVLKKNARQDRPAAHIINTFKSRLPQSSIMVLAHRGARVDGSAETGVPFITGASASPRSVKLATQTFDPANRLNPGLKLW